MSEENGVKNKIDIAVHEERLKQLEDMVRAILENHLPHLKDEIISVKLRIAYWSGGIGALLGLLQIIIAFYAK